MPEARSGWMDRGRERRGTTGARGWGLRLALAVVASGVGGAACAGAITGPVRSTSRAVTSNVLRSDYAGSRACADCHAETYAAWWGSPMHRMTRLPEGEERPSGPPFDGSTFRFK